jgi:hypothetical protein
MTAIVQWDRAAIVVMFVARVVLVRVAKPTTTVPETWDVAVASVTEMELPVQMGILLQMGVLVVHAIAEAGLIVPIRAAVPAVPVHLVPQTQGAPAALAVAVAAYVPRVPQVRAVNPAPIVPGF